MTTTRRTIRIDDQLWNAAKAKAKKEGTDVTAIIRKLLRAYVRTGAIVLAVVATTTVLAAGAGAQTPSQSVGEHLPAAAAALMIAASCDPTVGAVVAEIVNTSDAARAELDAFYAAGEAWQVAQARAKYAAGIPLTSAC